MTTRDNSTAMIAKQVASKWGVSRRYVYMIISGDRNNDAILDDFMELYEVQKKIDERYRKNTLTEIVEQLIPLEN